MLLAPIDLLRPWKRLEGKKKAGHVGADSAAKDELTFLVFKPTRAATAEKE